MFSLAAQRPAFPWKARTDLMIHLLVNSQHQVLHHRLSRLLCDPSSSRAPLICSFHFVLNSSCSSELHLTCRAAAGREGCSAGCWLCWQPGSGLRACEAESCLLAMGTPPAFLGPAR